MRKSLFLMCLLLILSVGILYSANNWVNTQKNAIEIKETTLFGDKAVAKRIEIESLTHCTNHLFWDTQFKAGDPLDIKTQFEFSQKRKNEQRIVTSQVMLSSNIDFGMSGNGLDLEQEKYLAIKPALDVATRTLNGATRTESVLLSDYYPIYPITMDINAPVGLDYNTHTSQLLTNYLQIPVTTRHKIKVSVTKSNTGEITDIDTNSISGSVSLYSESVFSDSGYYYIIKSYDEYTGKPLVLPERVSGIHFLPLKKVGEISEPNLTAMKCVYPFENESVNALSLVKNAEDHTLLLITEENNVIMLSVIDSDSMDLIQKTEITKVASDVSFSEIRQCDNFLVIYFSDQRFYLLTKAADRHYAIQMSESFPDFTNMDYLPFNLMQVAYNHELLAIAFYQEPYKSGLYLIVYDKMGLAYVGQYDQNTDRTLEQQVYKTVIPMDYTPLNITLKP